MKLIFAGEANTGASHHSNHLFNCVRNPQCQRPYFVPLRSLTELMTYVELPGKPSLVETFVVNQCATDCSDSGGGDFNDDFNNDFDIGADGQPCPYVEESVGWVDYVVGQDPTGNWYGVFSNLVHNERVALPCFFIKMNFTIGETIYTFYSQQYCFDPCDNLLQLKGCYPNEPKGANAYDCNGVYYGFPTGDETLGNPNFRYFHLAYVRKGSVIDSGEKLNFSFFNSYKTYRCFRTSEKTLEFELVPTFYKDELFGIVVRGNILIEGKEYKLTQEQNFKILDFDSKLWQLDFLLEHECRQYFGCAPADCLLPGPCDNPPNTLEFSQVSETITWLFAFSGGIMDSGDSIEWEIYEGDTLLDSGAILADPWDFVIDIDGFDPTKHCYRVKWRKLCHTGQSTDWQEEKVGYCGTVIQGDFEVIMTGGSRSGGPAKMIIDFDAPTPGPITFDAGFDATATGGGYLNHSSGYPLPHTFPAGSVGGCGFTEAIPTGPGPQTIPAGTSHYELSSNCAEFGAPYGYISKVVFFNLVLPAGYTFVLHPARATLDYEIR